MKKALITGITGQDGSYLAELLINRGYRVHGLVRRVATENQDHRLSRIKGLLKEDLITLHPGTLENYASIYEVVKNVEPDEVYHLGAQSFVAVSFDDEFSTFNTNINGTHHLLSACRTIVPHARFYFAGSSEMFGKVHESPQNENTPFHPRSAYGISKVAGFDLTRHYREREDIKMFSCSGILFNHESPRRGMEFVTRKITYTAAKIKLGLAKELKLGNPEAKRDWGFAGDYVEAMWLMLQQSQPDDYVIATGETHSIKEFVEKTFAILKLNPADYVTYANSAHMRPAEVDLLVGDASKAKTVLGWEPKVKFEQLVQNMVEADMKFVGKNRGW